jgi:hypothetical protein
MRGEAGFDWLWCEASALVLPRPVVDDSSAPESTTREESM